MSQLKKDGDRSLQMRVPVTGNSENTHVLLSVSYSAGRGYTMSAVPAEVHEDGLGVRFVLSDLEFARLEKASRYSANRLNEWGQSMVAEVGAGFGAAHDLLGTVLTKHGLEVAG